MPNRNLTDHELATLFRPLFAELNVRMEQLSREDGDLLWALRRKVAKELSYLERGTPMQRRALKKAKRLEQGNECAICHAELATDGPVLDRFEAMLGYTSENTQLICFDCDRKLQKDRGFK